MTDIKIYLNTNKERNINNTETEDFNCGGYALGTFNWYAPYHNQGYEDFEYSSESRDEEVQEMLDCGNSVDDIVNFFACKDADSILKDFPNLELISYEEVLSLPTNKKVVAFRESIVVYDDDPEYRELNTQDFHFKVRINGKWKEKQGGEEIHDCDLIPFDDWFVDEDLNYTGKIMYFIEK